MTDSRRSYKSPRMTYQVPGRNHWSGQAAVGQKSNPLSELEQYAASYPHQPNSGMENSSYPQQPNNGTGNSSYPQQQPYPGPGNPPYAGGDPQGYPGTAPYGAPMQPPYWAPKQGNPNRFGFALTSFILSVINILVFIGMFVVIEMSEYPSEAVYLLLGLFVLLNGLLATLAIIFGALSFKSSKGKGLGVTGFVFGVLNVLSILFLMVLGAVAG